jgi:hypothetical protein
VRCDLSLLVIWVTLAKKFLNQLVADRSARADLSDIFRICVLKLDSDYLHAHQDLVGASMAISACARCNSCCCSSPKSLERSYA